MRIVWDVATELAKMREERIYADLCAVWREYTKADALRREAIGERDEAREIARELAAYLKADVNDGRAVGDAYRSIRLGVRRWLEE